LLKLFRARSLEGKFLNIGIKSKIKPLCHSLEMLARRCFYEIFLI